MSKDQSYRHARRNKQAQKLMSPKTTPRYTFERRSRNEDERQARNKLPGGGWLNVTLDFWLVSFP